MIGRLRAAVRRCLAMLRPSRLDRDLADELESHLAHHIDDNLRAGMTPAEARRVALARLGGLTQTRERYRERRGVPAIERWLSELQYAVRSLRAMPQFTFVAVLTLGLGIGANVAIFSVANAVLFQQAAVDRPRELVAVNRIDSFPTHSYPDYRDFRDRNAVLAGLAAVRIAPVNLDADGRATRVWSQLSSGNYFELLGVTAALGRTFTPADDVRAGGHPVIVLSHACWQSRFGGDPAVVGRTVKLNGAPFTIIGVTPPGFRGTERLLAPALWLPVTMVAQVEPGNDWLERRSTHNLFLIGRLGPSVSAAAAESALNVIAEQLGREHPQVNEGFRVSLSPVGLVGNMLRGPVQAFAAALLGITAMVLLLACVNLAGLLLARSADRRRDTAIRLALGARRSDLIRRSLVESALVSLMSTAVAVLIAMWVARFVTAWQLPVDLPFHAEIALDWRVLLFSLLLAAIATALLGVVPAWQAGRAEIVASLKDDTARWRNRWQIRDVVVALQVALSTVVIFGALMVAKSLSAAVSVPLGFSPAHGVTARVDLALEGYDRVRGERFKEEVVSRLSALPGVTAAAMASALPLTQDTSTYSIHVDGKPVARGVAVPQAIVYQVSPQFFAAIGTRIVNGRGFSAADTADRPRVVVVNQAFADQLLLDRDPVGQRIRNGPRGEWTEIIGVIETGKYRTLTEAPVPVVYYSLGQVYHPSATVVLRTTGDERQALEQVRAVIRSIDPGVSIFDDRTLSELLALPLLPARVAASLLGAFGVLAVLLVLVGAYGLLSYTVAQRTREICIRIAIGASARQIADLVLARASRVWVAGVGTGLAVAFAGAPLLAPMLIGIAPRDPLVLVVTMATVAAVTVLACWRPTARALRSDPSALLRRG